jgi:hypothetical protein
MTDSVYNGRCFCGAIHVEVRGDPILAGYCHCQDCRDWSNAPVTSFAMWPYDAVTITQGEENLALFGRIPETPRAWCARCGGHIGAFRDKYDPPHVSLFPHMVPAFPFAPSLHVFCREAVIDIKDDLPRYRDLPKSITTPGTMVEGSGELMAGSRSP